MAYPQGPYGPRGPYGPQGPHGPQGHGAGYPGHFGPPHGGYGHGPPPAPPKRSNALWIVLAILAAVFVFGGGSCLLCVGLAAVSSDTSATSPEGSTASDGLARTELAEKLEKVLEGGKVPVGSVRCPEHAPSQGTFSCELVTTQGDRAELVVTYAPTGLAYDVPGVALLDGAMLATTFRGIVASVDPALHAPCLTGTLMKKVGADFTCPVFAGDTPAGTLTVHVLDKAGQVKMDFEGAAPTPGATATPPAGRTGTTPTANTASVDGRYECFHLRVMPGPNFTFNTQWVPGALPGFTIANGTYTSSGRQGVVTVSGAVVAFQGGGYDGWRGATDRNSTGAFILFRGKSPGDPQPGVGAKSGDYQCYRQKS